MAKLAVYIAGPYTKGDVVMNIRKAVEAADVLANVGCAPFIPHLSHLWHTISPHDYEFWLDQDMQWLERCDVLLRLPGESAGADREVDIAFALSIKTYYGVYNLLDDIQKGVFYGD